MILSHQSIHKRVYSVHGKPLIDPYFSVKTVFNGKSYGLSSAGYDIRVDLKEAEVKVLKPGDFVLSVSVEKLNIPNYLMVFVKDKSSWAREGLSVQNTVLEPGWSGYITLELNNHSRQDIIINNGDPIAQLIFNVLDTDTDMPYSGKYQNQPNIPIGSVYDN
jgi:dCTP deaminase